MAIKKISISSFLLLAKTSPVIDVRSPGEYAHAHIPGAISLPLFSDEERKIVGTAYKQQSREIAIKIGLDFFGPKMKAIVEATEKTVADHIAAQPATPNPSPATILIHCWRGGMRSGAVAWLLDLYGFRVYQLAGGYKAYRNIVLQQFDMRYNFCVIGGYTGSGKTLLLRSIQKSGRAIIDLEALANHRGSALGSLGKDAQPKQEMFENLIAAALAGNENASTVFIEDESQRIGDLQIPMTLWQSIRNNPVYFFEIPFEQRLEYVTEEYKNQSTESLVNSIIRIKKRLGGLDAKNAINFLLEGDHKESFRILLKYYDKYYLKGLYNREYAEEQIHKIPSDSTEPEINLQLLIKKIAAAEPIFPGKKL